MKIIEMEDVRKMLLDGGFEDGSEKLHRSLSLMERWRDRGDGIAVYQNIALDSSAMGHRKYMSFGSKAAQIEETIPPTRLPDIQGHGPGWKYQLVGIVPRGVDQ